MPRVLAALIVAATLLSVVPTIATADAANDYPVQGGHFFTQANGSSLGAQGGGYTISDSDGIPFWTFFTQQGGADQLGYPVSQRFVWDGYVCQALQRAVLQWNPAIGQVQLANVFDYLSTVGKDDWLIRAHLAPRAARTNDEIQQSDQPISFLNLAHDRFAWLYQDSPIFRRYFHTPNYYTLYGLPTSAVQDLGPYLAVRFQRVVMYHWKVGVPWADSQGVSIGLAGDLFKELGLIPAIALQPVDSKVATAAAAKLPVSSGLRSLGPTLGPSTAPAPVGPPTPPSSVATAPASIGPGPAVAAPFVTFFGVATWYGGAFQGQMMANGAPFNMYDPQTTANNLFPLGTWLRVTRITTGQSILVQVRDRGAFRFPDIVDLSYGAFSQLADPSNGVIGVRVEPVDGN